VSAIIGAVYIYTAGSGLLALVVHFWSKFRNRKAAR
jgi:hypothetical protein